eukprot:m.142069 g.142069  ORF g.142069 m.142069 type:complete len:997 (+) comp30230_c0_seq1:133-3123(+)
MSAAVPTPAPRPAVAKPEESKMDRKSRSGSRFRKFTAGALGRTLRPAAGNDGDTGPGVYGGMKSTKSRFRGLLYKIPLLNLFYTLVDIESDPPEWSQIGYLLQTLGIVNALVLSLVISFYTAIDFGEMNMVDMRFSIGVDHPAHPGSILEGGRVYLEFRDNDCLGTTKSEACIAEWERVGINTTGWSAAVNSTTASGSPYYPFCLYPCYSDRPISTDGNGNFGKNSFVSGNYARYWHTRWYFVPNDVEFSDFNTDVLCVDDSGENLCTGEDKLNHLRTPLQDFASSCGLSIAYLATALLLAILVLVVGSANNFNRGTSSGSYSYQYRTVAKSYLYWIRWTIIAVVLFTVVGNVQFLQSVKALVVCKFTDAYIEEHGHQGNPYFGLFTVGAVSPYTYVLSGNVILFYFPFGLCALLLSAGVYKLHTFPTSSNTDMNDVSTARNITRRRAYATDLQEFLSFVGGLPSIAAIEIESDSRTVQTGPRLGFLGCFGRTNLTNFREDHSIFLSGAAGDQGQFAEIVADTLIDHGIYDIRSFLRLILHSKLGGLGELGPVYGMGTIQDGAILTLMMGIRRFCALNATDNEQAGEDETAPVTSIRVPADYMTHSVKKYGHATKTSETDTGFTTSDSFIQHCFVKGDHIHGWKPLDAKAKPAAPSALVATYEKRSLYSSSELDEGGWWEIPVGKFICKTWASTYEDGTLPTGVAIDNLSGIPAGERNNWVQVTVNGWFVRVPMGGVAQGAQMMAGELRLPDSVKKQLGEMDAAELMEHGLENWNKSSFEQTNPIIPACLEIDVVASEGFSEVLKLPVIFFYAPQRLLQVALKEAVHEKSSRPWKQIRPSMFVKDLSVSDKKAGYVEYLTAADEGTFAQLKIDSAMLWYMQKLRDQQFEMTKINGEKTFYRRCMRIPDATLFPRENEYVMAWLFDKENLGKDTRLAFIEPWATGKLSLSGPEKSWHKMAKAFDAEEEKTLWFPINESAAQNHTASLRKSFNHIRKN